MSELEADSRELCDFQVCSFENNYSISQRILETLNRPRRRSKALDEL